MAGIKGERPVSKLLQAFRKEIGLEMEGRRIQTCRRQSLLSPWLMHSELCGRRKNQRWHWCFGLGWADADKEQKRKHAMYMGWVRKGEKSQSPRNQSVRDLVSIRRDLGPCSEQESVIEVDSVELTGISHWSLWFLCQELVGGGQGGTKEHSLDARAVP